MGDIIAILEDGKVPSHVKSGEAYIITRDGKCISAGIPSEYYETARSLYEYIRSHAKPGELSEDGIDRLIVGPGFGEGGGIQGIKNKTIPIETVEEGTTIEQLIKKYTDAKTTEELRASYASLRLYLEKEAESMGLKGQDAKDYVTSELAKRTKDYRLNESKDGDEQGKEEEGKEEATDEEDPEDESSDSEED